MQAIICGQGRQQYNYVQHKDDIVPAKLPGGGSFAVMVFNLGFFYQEHQHWRNIWTQSNENFDLVRYTGMSLKIFRPPTVDVICTVLRSYPMLVNSGTHPSCHPQRQLLAFKKYIIQSLKRKPQGKHYKKIKIKPPHLLNNRWFFAKDFINTNLCMVYLATADLERPFCSLSGDNNCTGFNSLNTNIFHNVCFQYAQTQYNPQPGKKLYGWDTIQKKWQELKTLNPYGPTNVFFSPYLTGKQKVVLSSKPPTSSEVTQQTWQGDTDVTGQLIVYSRYNPTPDEGDENIAYLLTMFRIDGLYPSQNTSFSLKGLPLWLLMYGYFDWMSKLHSTYNIFDNYVLVIQSPYIANIPELTYKGQEPNLLKYPPVIPISPHFINGKWLNDTDIPGLEQLSWYIKVVTQQTAVNNIVETGPFIPKPNKEFSWCVQANYSAYFKWGGTHHPSQEIDDPSTKPSYPVPNQQLKGVQIKDPRKTKQLHPWHWRRDQITKKALKRLLEDSDESSVESFTESPPKKKKEKSDPKPYPENVSDIQETSSSGTSDSQTSEEEEEILQQHLLKQHRKRKLLKRYLFRCLKNMQHKQRTLSILTGPTE